MVRPDEGRSRIWRSPDTVSRSRGGIVSYPMYAQPPEPRTRPRSVTISSYLLYAVAGVQLVTAVLLLTVLGTMTDVYREAYAGTSEEGLESIVLGGNVVTVVITVLISVGLVLLALFNNRGRNGSRITTWVIGGLSLCCGGLGVAGSALTSSMNLEGSGGNGPSATEVEQRLSDALPSWYNPISTTLSVIALVAMLVALILLALPASNAFFRKPAGHFDPSIPYPAYPGQPPYPGQPQPGQPYPGQPSYPGQPYPGQPSYSGQPYPGQPQPGQFQPGQPYPGQPQPGQFQPGQPYPGQPQPGQAPPETSGQSSSAPPASDQPSGSAPDAPPVNQTPPAGQDQSPHTGSVPPTDPWSAPEPADKPDRPPTDPTAQA
jgi:hypothetical protein